MWHISDLLFGVRPSLKYVALHAGETVGELASCYFPNMPVPQALQNALEFSVRQNLLVRAEESVEIHSVDKPTVSPVDHSEQLMRVVVLPHSELCRHFSYFQRIE